MSAQATENTLITIVLGSANVPLPDNQNLGTFTVGGGDTAFTVPSTGRYLISYSIALTVAVLMSSQVSQNGAPIAASIVSAGITIDRFSTEFIVNLNSGDTLSLQLAGAVGTATLLGSATTYMTVVRVE